MHQNLLLQAIVDQALDDASRAGGGKIEVALLQQRVHDAVTDLMRQPPKLVDFVPSLAARQALAAGLAKDVSS